MFDDRFRKQQLRKERSRNNRKWYEDDDIVVLADHHNGPTLVRIVGLRGDTPEQEVLYTVEELKTRQCYTASDRCMRLPKDTAERGRLLA